MDHIIDSLSENTLNELKRVSDRIRQLTEKTYDQMQSDFHEHITMVETLGRSGWTVNNRMTLQALREWISLVNAGNESSIVCFFRETEIEELLEDIYRRYTEANEQIYVERAIENYHLGYFTEAAFFFLALMNYRINIITPDKYHKLTKQCEEGIKQIGEDSFNNLSQTPLFRLFLVRDYITSFTAYASRTFIDSDVHNWNKGGTEPTFLNRNWLMHGRMTRLVKRYECVQIINAFSTLGEIERAILL